MVTMDDFNQRTVVVRVVQMLELADHQPSRPMRILYTLLSMIFMADPARLS